MSKDFQLDFSADLSLESFRGEVKEFLKTNLPGDLIFKPRGMMSARSDLVEWQQILYRKGWGSPTWSKEHGGTGWSVAQRLIFEEECVAAGAPTQDVFGQKLLGPVVNHFGTPNQISEHIPPILKGECMWCQGFSEPGSGSDLASLRTRAELQDHQYLVNGQKIWTSYAHRADWIFLLARTTTEAKKQAGISFLLIDMKSPGITVRPIRSIDDSHHLNEVFFDNVCVPSGNLIGQEGQGWAITKFLLNNEHATTAELPTLRGYLQRLAQLSTRLRSGGAELVSDCNFSVQLTKFETEVSAVSMMVARVAAMEQAQDHSPAALALGSMLKIRSTELQQRMSEFMVEALGDYGALAYPEPYAQSSGSPMPQQDIGRGIATDMFFRRASTIYGGSSEVQRGIVAKLLFQF